MMTVRTLLTAVITCLAASVACAQSIDDKGWREGDLIFIAPASENHITAVTGRVDHVAIFHRIGGVVPCVIEAIPQAGVTITPLDTLLAREHGSEVIVKHVNADCDIAASVRNALDYVGRDYDILYLPDNQEIYCSELVQLSYVDAAGQPIFHTIAMTFRDANGEIPAYWQELYRSHNMPVPEGKPGTNPSTLLKDV